MANTTRTYVSDLNEMLRFCTDADVIIFGCTMFTLCGLSIVFNTINVIVFATTKHLWTKYNWTIISLTVSDIVGGCIALVAGLGVSVRVEYFPSAVDVFISSVLMKLPAFLSQCHMLLIAMERYIAVVYPLMYVKLYTVKTSLSAILLTWILSLLLTFATAVVVLLTSTENSFTEKLIVSSKFNHVPMNIADTVIYFLVCGTLCVFYGSIVKAAKRNGNNQLQLNKSHDSGSRKTLLIACVLVIYFIVSWTPFVLCKLIISTGIACNGYIYRILLYFILLGYSNFANNHIVFLKMNPKFRSALINIICCYKRVGFPRPCRETGQIQMSAVLH